LHHAHREDARIPLQTGFLIFLFTILSQLFGASTGRESSAVQFGAAIAEFWLDLLEKSKKSVYFSRQAFVRVGLAAGFGAVFGVPWAGTFFALEVTPGRRWPFRYLLLCWISSFGAHWTALWWGTHHKIYPMLEALNWDLVLILKWIGLGFAFGMSARIFVIFLRFLEGRVFYRVPWPWLKPAVGATLVAVLTLGLNSTRYNGLGVNLIDASFHSTVSYFDFAWKGLFTLLSSASGLKGGEVTPLMAMGALLGTSLSGFLLLPSIYATSLGLVGIFAASAHIPWTGAVMAWELFGFEAFLPAFVVCWVGSRFVGPQGLFTINE
jgi:H+/Cl- antiporter ClcA